jgi:hypothetical protein
VKQVNFLSGVVGLTTKDPARRAIELEVPDIGRLRVIHPILGRIADIAAKALDIDSLCEIGSPAVSVDETRSRSRCPISPELRHLVT